MKFRMLLAAAAAATVAIGLMAAPPAIADVPPGESLQIEQVPGAVDQSNRAGWWHPIAEYDGSTYFAYDAPAATDRRHQVVLAKRDALGAWTSACLPSPEGGCVEYLDDNGHSQPSIAIDGDGYVHAFVSMHNSGWQYYRSQEPGGIAMVDASGAMPDQASVFTYPVPATAPNGDIYLLIRANPGERYMGNLYRYELASSAWTRVATVADQEGFTPYPDDLQVDANGRVHLLWEWTHVPGASGDRYDGTYLVYDPAAGTFEDVSGGEVTLPATTTSARYESRPGIIQTARMTLADDGSLSGVAYRYNDTGQFGVLWAEWDGAQWVRETLLEPTTVTASLGATEAGGITRVFFNQETTDCRDLDIHWRGGLTVVERRGDGDWETYWLGGERNTAQMAAYMRPDGTDVLYLSSWLDSPIDHPALYFATLDREGEIVPAAPGSGVIPDSGDLLAGATVTASSTRTPTHAECVADGNYWGENSRWVSAEGDAAPTLTLTVDAPQSMSEFRVYSGTRGENIVTDFTVRVRSGGVWTTVASVKGSPISPAVVVLDQPVTGDAVRIVFPRGTTRIYEIEAYAQATSSALIAYGASSTPPFIENPGGASDTTFTVYNRSASARTGELSILSPQGWTITPATQPYSIPAGGKQTVTFTTTAPADGTFAAVELNVVDAEEGELLAIPIELRDGILHATDGAPWYTETGAWLDSSLVGFHDTRSRYAQAQSCATATWTPTLPASGVYTVSVFATTNSQSATQAVYTVAHANGVTPIAVDQAAVSGEWITLGTFEFDDTASASVTLSAYGTGYHRAGSVFFEEGGELTARPAFPEIDSPCAGVPEPYTPVEVCEDFDRTDLTWNWNQEVVVTKGEVTVTKPAGGHDALLVNTGTLTDTSATALSNGAWAAAELPGPLSGTYGSNIQALTVCGWTR
ncbi:BNR-4 repeat-containing protein [Microbacterium sp. ZW CA_36]|uniref:BNR-4 repeat-containing protein n=1 Tax=Microbacterium sp. ZW CA_36 TaxID=3378078 RepID=UPI0038529F74